MDTNKLKAAFSKHFPHQLLSNSTEIDPYVEQLTAAVQAAVDRNVSWAQASSQAKFSEIPIVKQPSRKRARLEEHGSAITRKKRGSNTRRHVETRKRSSPKLNETIFA